MRLSVNGEEYVTEQDSLAALLKEMGIGAERVAVEVNLCVIKKKDLENCRLRDGDTIEIVSFIGGGTLNNEAAEFGEDTEKTKGTCCLAEIRSDFLCG